MNDMDDKLIQMAQAAGGTKFPSGSVALSPAQLAAYRSAILADAAKDVQVVAWMMKWPNHGPSFTTDKSDYVSWFGGKASYPDGLIALVPASTLAAAQALNAELVARVAELGAALRTADRTFAENGILASHAARQEIQSALTKGQP